MSIRTWKLQENLNIANENIAYLIERLVNNNVCPTFCNGVRLEKFNNCIDCWLNHLGMTYVFPKDNKYTKKEKCNV